MKIMNKLKAGISFIAFLPSTLYVFSYFRLKKRAYKRVDGRTLTSHSIT